MGKNAVAKIGVDLTAKIAGFEANMAKATRTLNKNQKKMNRSLERIEGGFKKLSGRIAAFATVAGVTVLARGLSRASESAIAFGDTLAKQADRIGVSVEALQELRFAAERGGLGLEALDGGLLKLSKGLGEAKANTGTLVTILKNIDPDLLKRLIDADDLDVALKIILDRLAQTENVMERNAIAAAAFGRSAGAAFGAFAKDVDPLRAKLRDLGGVLDEELARNAEIVADKLTDLDVVLKNKLHTSVLENIDGFVKFKTLMNEISQFSVEMAANIGTLSGKFDNFLDSLPGTTLRDNANESALKRRAKSLQKVIDADLAVAARIDARAGSAAADRLKMLNDRIEKNTQNLQATLAKLEEIATAPTGGSGTSLTGSTGALGSSSGTSGTALVGKSKSSLTPLEKRAKEAGDRIRQIFEQTRTPLEALTAQLKEIDALRPFAQTPAELDAINRALKNVSDQMGELNSGTQVWRDSIQDATRGIADALSRAIVFSDNLGDSLKRLAKQLAARALTNLFLSLIPGGGGASGGGGFSSLFGGGKAGGGRSPPNVPVEVGERGREFIVPDRASTVMNNADSRRAFGGQSVVIHQTIAPNFAGNAATIEDVRMMSELTKQSAMDGVMRALRRPRHA